MSFSVARRALLGAIALATLPSYGLEKRRTTNLQDLDPESPIGKPYDKVPSVVKADKDRVRLLFTYDCQFCRSYHNGIVQWGNTLPSPLRFEATPVLTSDSDNLVLAIYGRLLMQGLAPSKLKLYDYAMYTYVQGDKDAGVAPKQIITADDVIRLIGQQAEVPLVNLRAFIKKHGAAIEKQIPNHAMMISTYGLKATPSVAIGGQVVVTPDHAGGDPQQFLLLLNALTSRLIQGGLNAL